MEFLLKYTKERLTKCPFLWITAFDDDDRGNEKEEIAHWPNIGQLMAGILPIRPKVIQQTAGN